MPKGPRQTTAGKRGRGRPPKADASQPAVVTSTWPSRGFPYGDMSIAAGALMPRPSGSSYTLSSSSADSAAHDLNAELRQVVSGAISLEEWMRETRARNSRAVMAAAEARNHGLIQWSDEGGEVYMGAAGVDYGGDEVGGDADAAAGGAHSGNDTDTSSEDEAGRGSAAPKVLAQTQQYARLLTSRRMLHAAHITNLLREPGARCDACNASCTRASEQELLPGSLASAEAAAAAALSAMPSMSSSVLPQPSSTAVVVCTDCSVTGERLCAACDSAIHMVRRCNERYVLRCISGCSLPVLHQLRVNDFLSECRNGELAADVVSVPPLAAASRISDTGDRSSCAGGLGSSARDGSFTSRSHGDSCNATGNTERASCSHQGGRHNCRAAASPLDGDSLQMTRDAAAGVVAREGGVAVAAAAAEAAAPALQQRLDEEIGDGAGVMPALDEMEIEGSDDDSGPRGEDQVCGTLPPHRYQLIKKGGWLSPCLDAGGSVAASCAAGSLHPPPALLR
jgi:hypothetical protein